LNNSTAQAADGEEGALTQSDIMQKVEEEIDNQVTAYRQSKAGSVNVVAAVAGPSVIEEHVRGSDIQEYDKEKAPELNYVT
jgi:hypothetical protein